jgi:hypothetical protein
MNYNKVQINEFKNKQIVSHPAIFVYGNKNDKINRLVNNLVEYLSKTPTRKIYFLTNETTTTFDTTIKTKICSDIVIIKKILTKQIELVELYKNNKKIVPHVIIIIGTNYDIVNDSFKELLMNGRHYHISVIIKNNKFLSAAPEYRFNMDYIFVSDEKNKLIQKRIWNNFFSHIPSILSFSKILELITTRETYLVYDNRNPSNSILENIFWHTVTKKVGTKNNIFIDGLKYIDGLFFNYHSAPASNVTIRKKRNNPFDTVNNIIEI